MLTIYIIFINILSVIRVDIQLTLRKDWMQIWVNSNLILFKNYISNSDYFAEQTLLNNLRLQ